MAKEGSGNEKKWNKLATNILKAELAKRGLSYIDLQEKLKQAGIDQTIENIRLKMSRGTFASSFLLQCLWVIGVKTLNLSDYCHEENKFNI